MKEKLAQFIGGLVIYSIFGVIMVWVAGNGFEGQWTFIISWTLGMSLISVFIIEPLRVRLARKKAARENKS